MKVYILALAIDVAAIDGSAGLYVVSADGNVCEGCSTPTISLQNGAGELLRPG